MVFYSVETGDERSRDKRFMRFLRRYVYCRGLALGLAVALLTLAFTCPLMLPTFCASNQQSCQSPTCWLLVSGSVVPVLVVFIWFLWATAFALPREYPLLLFRPPRPLLPQLL
jgi:hypothetical protein